MSSKKTDENSLDMSKPSTKREQGSYADTSSMSENSEKAIPRTQERGIGSSFAMAVSHLINNAKNVKEQGKDFSDPNLGIITPKELSKFGKTHQPENFNHKKKLTDK